MGDVDDLLMAALEVPGLVVDDEVFVDDLIVIALEVLV